MPLNKGPIIPQHGTKRLSGDLVGGGNVIQFALPEDGTVTF